MCNPGRGFVAIDHGEFGHRQYLLSLEQSIVAIRLRHQAGTKVTASLASPAPRYWVLVSGTDFFPAVFPFTAAVHSTDDRIEAPKGGCVELKLFTPLLSIEHELQEMFDRMFGRNEFFVVRPTVDVFNDEGRLVVKMDLPGIDPDKDVEILVEGDSLVIKGEKEREKETEEKDRYLYERSFGSFRRIIPLPDGVDIDKIEAGYDKGVLTVTLPMAELPAAETKKIPVTTA
jgi:HSP20 family protein